MRYATFLSFLPDDQLNELLNDPAGLDRLLADIAAVRPLPEQERDNEEELERWDLCD